MWQIVTAGGWLMLPILACSVIAMAIIVERFFMLRKKKVLPANLVVDVWRLASSKQLTEEKVREYQMGSPLGRVVAAGLANRHKDRDSMKVSIEEVGGQVAHELERYLNALGTIAAITPLLGLLGTVVGMIKVFTNITTVGVGNPAVLAGGISQALITTASGLMIAIPALIFYRYFRGKVDGLVVDMEKESIKLLDVLQKRQSRSSVATT